MTLKPTSHYLLEHPVVFDFIRPSGLLFLFLSWSEVYNKDIMLSPSSEGAKSEAEVMKRILQMLNIAILQNEIIIFQSEKSFFFRQESTCVRFIYRLSPVTISQSNNEPHPSCDLTHLIFGPCRKLLQTKVHSL